MAEATEPLSLLEDDFTHLSADISLVSNCMSASSLMSKSQYGQVIFHDLCDIYPTDSDIKCRYSLTDIVQPQLGDKIALFKVGWLSVSEYIIFEHAQIPEGNKNTMLHVTFTADTLPKDTVDLYQLCYITWDNVVVGASVPFGFRKPHETEFVAVEDPNDPGLLVFRSRVTQLQEELNKAIEEKESLNESQRMLEVRMLALKGELIIAQSEKEKLRKEIDQLSDQLKAAREENKVLEDKMLNNPIKQKLAALREELVSADNVKTKLEQILKDKLSEINVHVATIECLNEDRKHVDENLREQLNMNEQLINEKQALEEKIKTLKDELKNCTTEKLSLSKQLNNSKETIEGLQNCIKEKEELISKTSLGYSDIDSLKLALMKVEEDKAILTASLENLQEHHEKCESKIFNLKESERQIYECLQIELNKADEQYKKKEEKFIEENKLLLAELETLKSLDASQEMKYEVEEEIKLKLRNTLQEKAELGSRLVQATHEKDENARLLTEKMNEVIELQRQIKILESKFNSFTMSSSRSMTGSEARDEVFLDSKVEMIPGNEKMFNKFVENIEIVDKFNKVMSQKSVLEDQLGQERTQKLALQKKVEDLMLKNSQMYSELHRERNKSKALLEDKWKWEESATGEHVILLQKVLDDYDCVKRQTALDMDVLCREKEAVEIQLMNLRKETVGKVSLGDAQKLHEEIATLKEKLQRKDCCADVRLKLESAVMRCEMILNALKKVDPAAAEKFQRGIDNQPGGVTCPLCPLKFPVGSYDMFHKHFEAHS